MNVALGSHTDYVALLSQRDYFERDGSFRVPLAHLGAKARYNALGFLLDNAVALADRVLKAPDGSVSAVLPRPPADNPAERLRRDAIHEEWVLSTPLAQALLARLYHQF